MRWSREIYATPRRAARVFNRSEISRSLFGQNCVLLLRRRSRRERIDTARTTEVYVAACFIRDKVVPTSVRQTREGLVFSDVIVCITFFTDNRQLGFTRVNLIMWNSMKLHREAIENMSSLKLMPRERQEEREGEGKKKERERFIFRPT